MKDIRAGDRVEGKPEGLAGGSGIGTVKAIEDGGEYGYPGKIARVAWDGIPGLGQWLPVSVLRVTAVGGLAEQQAAEAAAPVRGTSEDVYSAAVAALAAVIGGAPKAVFFTKGWTVQARLTLNHVTLNVIPDAGEVLRRPRASVQTFPMTRADGRTVQVTVPEDDPR